MPVNSQLSVKDESTYGTAVTTDRFFEFNSEAIKAVNGRIEYSGLRSGEDTQRSDRFVVVPKGAAGPIKLNPLTKGFGFWLPHMMGSVSTGATSDGVTPHTATFGTLRGKSFTAQVNRYDETTGTDHPFTWAGGKIPSWELACDVEGLLEATFNTDFQSQTTATALASPSYPTPMELFSFAGAVVQVAGTPIDVTNWKVGVDTGQKTDRHHLRGSTLKREPVRNKKRLVTWEITPEFDSMTQYNRYVSATASGALATIIATFTAPTLVGAASFPSIVVTIDKARFDDADPSVSGEDLLTNKLAGRGLFGSSSPVSIVYTTADATP